MLDNRLRKIAELVSGVGITADVGTDHAYLAAELINSGRCRRVIASDIKEGPLESARNTVERYGIQDKVELVLSDGLKNVPLDGVSDVVIAGMGGETIAAIIEQIDVSSGAANNIRWILQPMTKPEILRKKLYEYGLAITNEQVVEEGGKLYVIIAAEYTPESRYLTEAESICGFFENDEIGRKYRRGESERLEKAAKMLEKSGKRAEAVHFLALSEKLKNGIKAQPIVSIIDELNASYPFDLQEKWDNSGYLVESRSNRCSKLLLTLDITCKVANEAGCKGAELVVSHHPVIFEPRKKISRIDPVYVLIQSGVGALCMHTNLDIACGGTNGVILEKLRECLEIAEEPEQFENLGGGNGLGWIVTLCEGISVRELAEVCKSIFGCRYVRTSKTDRSIRRIAFCSGSGGSLLGLAPEMGCDALITGDVKHDVWIDADNLDIALLDCGHFHTENIVLTELRRVLEEKFPQLDIEISERSVDPCQYV